MTSKRALEIANEFLECMNPVMWLIKEEIIMFEIRVYYQRYNMDYDYYSGDKGIKRRWKAKTKEELVKKWKQHLNNFEGDTYSVWVSNDMIVGGAYDPDDIDCIEEYLDKKGE